MSKIFGNDRTTINGLYTFRKSEIQGMMTKAKYDPSMSNYLMETYLIVGGTEYMIDTKWADKDISDLDNQKIEYHHKWQETLSNINDDEIKKEKKII